MALALRDLIYGQRYIFHLFGGDRISTVYEGHADGMIFTFHGEIDINGIKEIRTP